MKSKVDLFIVGCIKGGTTWLYDVLSTSPDIYAPMLKEPHYFSRIKQIRPHIKHVNDYNEYLALYQSGDSHRYRMDGSASYLYEKNTAQRIYEYNPDAKILILLRHPVRRAFSHYQMLLREGVLVDDFEKIIDVDYYNGCSMNDSHCLIKMGEYFGQVKNYYDLFGNNVLVLTFSDLLNSKEQLIKEVTEFISINYSELEIKNEKSNATALPKNKLSRLILGTNSLRYIIQKALPKSFRVFIKNKYLLEKSSMKLQEEKIVQLYNKYFKSDSEKLFELINRRSWNEVNDI
ncbi:MAG: sulfotransferase [Candidatus Thiodiazotropha weberae]|nr:sulfotransferase [Candidatus Thiodiazotropha lotti]MCG8012049.1 sulfotransferase [Candidatus Thiodiazotropha lotti]MCG8019509.1 sulfotransferase [Candidatus Thiodiazotropha lotti]MCW4206671.1 sulfotransferase [Candidatus Thiodiazotropha lotti]MCW4211516.1 sulfotransferase [Candidatus Thiodiazotropha lotti]